MSLVVGDRSSLLLCFSCLDIFVTAQKRRNRKRSRMAQLFPGRIRGKAVNGLVYAARALLHLVKRS